MRSRSALAWATAMLCLTACASSSNSPPAFTTVLVDQGAVNSVATPSAQHVFAATQAKTWTALAAAYSALGFPVDIEDPATHRVGISNFYVSGQMNGQPVSHFAECGSGPTGPLAETRRVYFSAVTMVTVVDATHTALVTNVNPIAVDMTGDATDRISCGSTGALEGLLYDAVAKQLGGK